MTTNANKSTMRIPHKIGSIIGLISLSAAIIGLALFFHPQPLFRWSVKVNNLFLYSDEPFSTEAGKKLLNQVQSKLSASRIYSSGEPYAIFICNTPWRRSFLFIGDENAGGIVYYPLSTNVFLSGGVIEENRKTSQSGRPDVLGRKLDHFIAHEIAHVLNGKAMNWIQFHYLPTWIKEGYAEFIGSSDVFNYDETAQAFLNNSSKMNTPPSVPYLRYNFLVASLLEKENWSEEKLFETKLSQLEVENMLKGKLSQEK